MVNIALAYSRFKGYVPYTQQETRMNREIKNVVRNAREVNRRLHYHRLMTGSYKALFLMFGQYISREDQKMTLRTLQGESPEDLGNETGHSKSFVVHSCERAINEIHYYCSLLRGGNPGGPDWRDYREGRGKEEEGSLQWGPQKEGTVDRRKKRASIHLSYGCGIPGR